MYCVKVYLIFTHYYNVNHFTMRYLTVMMTNLQNFKSISLFPEWTNPSWEYTAPTTLKLATLKQTELKTENNLPTSTSRPREITHIYRSHARFAISHTTPTIEDHCCLFNTSTPYANSEFINTATPSWSARAASKNIILATNFHITGLH